MRVRVSVRVSLSTPVAMARVAPAVRGLKGRLSGLCTATWSRLGLGVTVRVRLRLRLRLMVLFGLGKA